MVNDIRFCRTHRIEHVTERPNVSSHDINVASDAFQVTQVRIPAENGDLVFSLLEKIPDHLLPNESRTASD